jgi:hypothetical protein
MKIKYTYYNKILLSVLISIITISIIQAQDLTQTKNGWTKQKTIVYAGIGSAIPSGKPAYRTLYDYRGATPVTLVGLTASVGTTYFFTKHWGINAELNGDYYLNDHNTGYKSYGATAHKFHWVDAHLLIAPIYSIRINKLAIDLKMIGGLNMIHLGACSVSNTDSTKTFEASKINMHGITLGWGIRGRYTLRNNLGCFVSIDNTVDADIFGTSFHSRVGSHSYTDILYNEYTYYTIQFGISFFIYKKHDNQQKSDQYYNRK